MEVVEEPVFIFQSTIYHLQEISERTRFVVAVHGQYDACGGTVGNYVVCSPACLIRCLQGSKMFLIRGQPSGHQDRPSTRNLFLPLRFRVLCLAWKFGSAGFRSRPPHRGSWPRPDKVQSLTLPDFLDCFEIRPSFSDIGPPIIREPETIVAQWFLAKDNPI